MPRSNGFYKVEKGIPVPGLFTNVSAALRALKPSESVLLPQYKDLNPVSGLLSQAEHKVKSKLTAQVVEGGVRVWRLS